MEFKLTPAQEEILKAVAEGKRFQVYHRPLAQRVATLRYCYDLMRKMREILGGAQHSRTTAPCCEGEAPHAETGTSA